MGRKKRRVSLLSGISPMSLASVMTSAAGDAALTYEGAYINRSGETNGSNKTISLGFSGEVPTGSDYKTGITIEVTGDNGSNYETLDLDATTQAIVNTNYIQYTLTGTVDTFQGLSGTEGQQVKISYDGSQTWYDGTITDDTTLNNASTINLLEDIVEVWHLSDADAAIASANDLTNNNVVTFVPAKLGVGAQMSRTGPKYLSHADSSVFNPSADFTWSFWIKFDTVGIWQYIISKFDWSGATNADYLIYTQDTSVMNFLKKASGVSKRVTWGTALNATDTWYHIVAYNEDNVEIGLSVDAGTHVVLATETGMDDNALPIAFGSSSDGAAASAVAGIMDEIALHSKALSADEVTDLYNGGDGKAYPYLPDYS